MWGSCKILRKYIGWKICETTASDFEGLKACQYVEEELLLPKNCRMWSLTCVISLAFSSASSGEKSGSRHILVICSVTCVAVMPIRLLGPAETGNESEIMEGLESKDS